MALEDMNEDERAFAEAFYGEDGVPAESADEPSVSPSSEDGASGAAAQGEGEQAVAVIVADGEALEQEAGQAAAEATTTSAEEELDQPTDPKEIQRQKSWEGRLRAREEELARKEAELAAKAGKPATEESGESTQTEAMEQAAEQLQADGNSEGAERVEEVAEKVESGELTADQAMRILAEDFGPEFVKMIQVIAGTSAKDEARNVAREVIEPALGEVRQSVNEIIDTITDDKTRAHFTAIAAKHPDFNEVAESPEFNQFLQSYENGEQIASQGATKDVIALLDAFKASKQPPAEEVADPAIEDAQGVRSRGMRLPETPTRSNDFENAWDEF